MIGLAGCTDHAWRIMREHEPFSGVSADEVQVWCDALGLRLRAGAVELNLLDEDGDMRWAGLVATPWGLWTLNPDGSASVVAGHYCAQGSGQAAALGAMFVGQLFSRSAEDLVRLGVQAAVEHAEHCAGEPQTMVVRAERVLQVSR